MASLWTKPTGLYCISYKKDGKTVNRSLRTKNRREALQLKREIEALLEETSSTEFVLSEKSKEEIRNPTIEVFKNYFFEWTKANLALTTHEEYQNWFSQFVEHSQIAFIGDANTVLAESFKSKLLRQGKRKPKGVGLCHESINDALKALQSIWNWAIKLNLYSGQNPFQGIKRFKIPKNKNKSFLDKDAIDKLLLTASLYHQEKYIKTMDAQNTHCAIALMALAGLRKKEVSFAKWEWIDWDKKMITVENNEHFTTKNKESRSVSLNEKLLEVLGQYRKESGYILEETRKTNSKNRYRVEIKRGFNSVCTLAGIETSPHQLRHSFASRHAIAGTSLHVLAGWLGHSTTWVTERYAHFQSTYNEAANNI